MRTKHTFFVILFIGFLYFLWQQQVYFFLTEMLCFVLYIQIYKFGPILEQ